MSGDSSNLLEVNKINLRGIKPNTERMLWGVSAGICEFRGCNRKLYTHHVTGENVNQSEKAHIYAFSSGGKRFWPLLKKSDKINDIENLMLVCESCHKLIDSTDTDYTPEQLLCMKKEHEERISSLVSIKPDLKTQVLIYNANIANKKLKISDFVACSEIIPDHYPISVKPLNLSPDLLLFDNESDYWEVMSRDLERNWRIYEPNLRDKHISIFAIAPQPLLFKLGTLINRNYAVDVRQVQSSIDNWKWVNKERTIELSVVELVESEPNLYVVVTLEITAKLSDIELRNTFGESKIYRIIACDCNPNLIKSKNDLSYVIEHFRKVLNTIRETNSQTVRVKLVLIAPLSVSIEAGRQLMKGDPTIILYDRHYITKEWNETLILNNEEESNA